MKNTSRPNELTISEREELIRLRAETEYLRTENGAKINCLETRKKGCATQGEKAAIAK